MSFVKTLFSIALPIILQDTLTSFVNMLDTIMVGQMGSVEIAAVGLGNQVFFLMSLVIFGIAGGGSVFIAQYWGKNDLHAIHKTTGLMLKVSFIFTSLFALLSIFIPELVLSLYSKDPDVIALGAKYLRIVAPSYIFFGINVCFASSERSTEHLKLPAIATISNLLYPVCTGCGNATGIIIGKTIGEGKPDEAKVLAKKITFFILGISFILGLFIIPLSRFLPYVFKVEPDVISMATIFIFIRAFIFGIDAFNMTCVVGVFRSGGDTLYALLVDTGIMWILAIPLGWLAVELWHLPFWAVYLCLVSEPLIKSVFAAARLLSGKWLRKII